MVEHGNIWEDVRAKKMARETLEPPEPDMVNHPPHYTHVMLPNGPVECVEMGEALDLPHHLFSAFEYIWRWDKKGDPVENIRKAAWWLSRYADKLEVER